MDRHEVQVKMAGGSETLMDISDAVKLDIPEGAIRIEVSATLYFEMWDPSGRARLVQAQVDTVKGILT